MKYRPRNDFVVLRIINRGFVGKLAVSDRAAQGKSIVVEAIGPDVKPETIKVGDRVHAIGQMGQDLVQLPEERDLILTRQSNVVVILEEEPAE